MKRLISHASLVTAAGAMRPRPRTAWGVTALALVAMACGAKDDPAAGAAPDAVHSGDTHADTTPSPGWTSALPAPYLPTPTLWAPATVLRLDPAVRRRGLREVRGLIHAHSAYSHDACDGKPFDAEGKINAPCVEDFRRDACVVGHEFVFLTDHPTHFGDHPFPDVLHYQPAKGDLLIERGGKVVANRMACADGRSVLLLPGTEGGTMAIGLDGHIAGAAARQQAYGGESAAARAALAAGGARVLAQHTEDWTAAQLGEDGWHGFEMYNLHANMMARMKQAGQLIPIIMDETETLAPDLILVPLLWEDPRYLTTWAQVLHAGHRRVTTLGTDCHRNTFTMLMRDGERVDSYRRMMIWFSNHLLVAPAADGGVDDQALEAALDARRLFGVFEVFGHAEGFDARIERADGTVVEIGGEVAMSAAPVIIADTPRVARLPADVETPQVRTRILQADKDGWIERASGSGEVRWPVTAAGAYRVEVRITPRHLRGWLGSLAEWADQEAPWIYANSFLIRDAR